MTASLRRVVIVGSSLAGLQAAQSLRSAGYGGAIIMVGDEPHLPYDRPPLSKQLLSGSWDPDRTQLRPDAVIARLGLTWRRGVAAVALDPEQRRVELADGGTEAYDAVLIATGTSPRRVANPLGLTGIRTLRTLDDSVALRAALEDNPRVVVVGGGFIGAEVAAEARRRSLPVTMVEALSVPLSRGLGTRLGQLCADLHVANGVQLLCGVRVSGFEGDGHLERVVLSDGTVVDADLAVVGIGSEPATAWLETSGLTLDDGVVCDSFCRASAPGVYAAGDVARWHNPLFDEVTRIEHWTNAREQAAAAVATLLADHGLGPEPAAYAPVPYVWSDQYGRRIQVAGRTMGAEEVTVVHHDPDDGATLALYRFGCRLGGVAGINASRRLLPFRRMIAGRVGWDEALAAAG
ncbi:MAG TPA: FAD-dependent oxidoreductase [Intrasporangium sp.]|uniref:NAD(P)/FAD-dependent oxidoreductase n=1 Tax=Intrasporangium sp. TaxID=1925024 RepID=UPI002D783F1C|nr:FAD-dependent oxidoreductase [Intrasporangium sp.]HET7397398.1 FAD-dependent oxidoreductase [Intrasporangium sp.]